MNENIALRVLRKSESDNEEYQEINQAPSPLLIESPVKEVNDFDFFTKCNTKKYKSRKKRIKPKTKTVMDIINSELASTPLLQENVIALNNDNKQRPSYLTTGYKQIVNPSASGLEESGYVNKYFDVININLHL